MKILVADDHALFREGMRHLLPQLQERVEVIEAGNCAEALRAVSANDDIALILLDLSMPGRDGFAALEALSREHSRIPVVVLSASESREAMQRALDHGALGYIPKTASATVMLQALRLVLAGSVYVPPALVQPAALARAEYPAATPHAPTLTPRQCDVLALVLQAKSNQAIAAELGLSKATVKAHIAAVFKTLGVNNRAHAALAAKRLGLVPEKAAESPEQSLC
jgi:two-component system, NarL family, nitrate/nitrite response regulator NarL